MSDLLPDLCIHFSHSAYNLATRFAERHTDLEHFQTWNREALAERIADSEVLVISGFWDNALLADAKRLQYIHVCAVGYDQFDQDALRSAQVRLTNSAGVNANAVSEQALSMVLAFQRHLHTGRDHQRARHWRPMISDLGQREDELPGKTMLIYGLGTIGQRVSRLAQAFGVKTLGIKRDLSQGADMVDELHPPSEFSSLLPRADFVVLTCPLTEQTRHLIDARALEAMAPHAYLVNVARGGCVDQDALIEALRGGAIAGAGLDVTEPEPLGSDSPLWEFDNVILTPHSAGETRRYEDNVLDTLLENLRRMQRGQALLNAIV